MCETGAAAGFPLHHFISPLASKVVKDISLFWDKEKESKETGSGLGLRLSAKRCRKRVKNHCPQVKHDIVVNLRSDDAKPHSAAWLCGYRVFLPLLAF